MRPRVKFALQMVAKVSLTAALVVWLVRSGALDFGALAIMVEQPWLLALDLAVFAFTLVLGTLRWRALLEIAEVEVPLPRLLQLQLAASFFNVVIPGGMGGDLLKALYVARDAKPSQRPTILLVSGVDQLVGLAGLLAVASLVVLLRGRSLWQDPELRGLATVVGLLCAAAALGPLVFVLVTRRLHGRLELLIARLDVDVLTSGPSRIAQLLNQYVALNHLLARLLSTGPKKMFGALSLSVMMSGVSIGLFTVLTRVILGRDVSYAAVAMVFPLGTLSTAIPVTPAGLGVGHVAFDRLFSMIGLTGGATIFNVYLIGQMAPRLLGVVPYLALRTKGALPTANEAEYASSEAGADAGADGAQDK